MRMSDAERFQPETLADWAAWLAANHTRQGGVWVVNWRSPSGRVPVSYEEMVCEALCWGWIDGQVKVLDELRGIQWWAPRRARSGWSASNKARVAELERQGRLQPPGIAEIERAKANGMWTVYDTAEALQEPPELTAALDADPPSRAAWDASPPSSRKQALITIALARLEETRQARLATIMARLARGERPA